MPLDPPQSRLELEICALSCCISTVPYGINLTRNARCSLVRMVEPQSAPINGTPTIRPLVPVNTNAMTLSGVTRRVIAEARRNACRRVTSDRDV